MAQILVADGDPNVRTHLQNVLGNAELGRIEVVANGSEALKRLCKIPFDLAILEMAMAQFDGLQVLQVLRQRGIRTEVVMLTRQTSIQNIVQALRLGAQDCLGKPVPSSDLVEAVCRLLEKKRPSPHYLANRLNVFLREHADQSPLRLGDLCRYFSISRGYATRLFQRHIGTTFTQQLTYYRIEKAKDLLESTDDPMYLIAAQCGFKNSRRLAETFRKLEGISPVKYRQKGGYQPPGSYRVL
jgi:two-component system response regulator YesN